VAFGVSDSMYFYQQGDRAMSRDDVVYLPRTEFSESIAPGSKYSEEAESGCTLHIIYSTFAPL
jgi:hypothetical protein